MGILFLFTGILFLALFTLAEIVLVVLTSSKFSKKADWMKIRAIVRGAEAFLLLGIILIPGVNMKWRFFIAIGILIVRFIFDVVMCLFKRKKTDSTRKTGRSVVNCILSVVLIAAALVPAFLFTNYNGLATTGEYNVKEVSVIFSDSNRNDPFENDGSKREVPARFYYPEKADGIFPLIVFSHGAFGYYQSNYSTYAELVSNGYIVVALDHPHHAFFTEDTDGKIITVDTNFINNVMKMDEYSTQDAFDMSSEWLKIRTEDENFVLDAIKSACKSNALNDAWHTEETDMVIDVLAHTDTDKIGLVGHSLGGATSVTLGRERTDISAVIDLDGTMLGEQKAVENDKYVYYTEHYPVPVLDLRNEEHYNMSERFESEHGYPYVNDYVIENAKDGMAVGFCGSEHMDFTDLPLFSPFLASKLGSGDIDHEKMMNTVNAVVLNWFDYYLKNEGTLDIQAQY